MDPHVLKAATDLIVETTDWEESITERRGHGPPRRHQSKCNGIPTVVIRRGPMAWMAVPVEVSTGYSSLTIFIDDISPGKES